LSEFCVAQTLEQLPAGYPGHLVVDSRPLRAPPLGTKKNEIAKLRGYIIHDTISLLPESRFDNPGYLR